MLIRITYLVEIHLMMVFTMGFNCEIRIVMKFNIMSNFVS